MIRKAISIFAFAAALPALPTTSPKNLFPGQIEISTNILSRSLQVRPNGEIWSLNSRINDIARFDSNLNSLPPLYVGDIQTEPFLNLQDGSFLVNLGTAYPRKLNHISPTGTLLKVIPTDGEVYSLAMQADGKILMGGNFTIIDGKVRNYVARLNPDLSVDPSFNPGTGPYGSEPVKIQTVAPQNDGSIYIGGNFTHFGLERRNRIARLLPTGALDISFNAALLTERDEIVKFISTMADQVYAGTSRKLVRFSSIGVADQWGYPFFSVSSLKIQSDGKLIAATESFVPGPRLLRFRLDGSIDPLFPGLPKTHSVVSLALDSRDRAFVSGLSSDGRNVVNYFVRLASDATATLNFKLSANIPNAPHLQITAPAGATAIIYRSLDLFEWSLFASNVVTNFYTVLDLTNTATGLQFFRGQLK